MCVLNSKSLLPVIDTTMHKLMAAPLGMLLAARCNFSYERYQKAGTSFDSLVSSASHFLSSCIHFSKDPQDFHVLCDYVLGFCHSLKQRLQADPKVERLYDFVPMPQKQIDAFSQSKDHPSLFLTWIKHWIINRDYDKHKPLSISALDKMAYTRGTCESLINTPIPFSIMSLLHQLLVFYLITLPMAIVSFLGWMSIPFVLIMSFGLLGIEAASNEIMEPYGCDPNDLDLESTCKRVEDTIHTLKSTIK